MRLLRRTRPLEFLRQRIEFESIGDGNLHPLEHDRLGHEVDRTQPDSLHGFFEVVVLYQHDDRNIDARFTHFCKNCAAVHVGHGQIEKYERDVFTVTDETECTCAAIRKNGSMPHAQHSRFEAAALNRIIIRYKNTRTHGCFTTSGVCAGTSQYLVCVIFQARHLEHRSRLMQAQCSDIHASSSE
ncbi:hypothetical protein D9M70_542900 [compost metagenome]